jgi:hypothetical protein
LHFSPLGYIAMQRKNCHLGCAFSRRSMAGFLPNNWRNKPKLSVLAPGMLATAKL